VLTILALCSGRGTSLCRAVGSTERGVIADAGVSDRVSSSIYALQVYARIYGFAHIVCTVFRIK
jgi:hypothetical protein